MPADVSSLIQAAIDNNPVKVKDSISELMTDKVRAVIMGKRAEIAQKMFVPDEDQDSDDDDTDLDDEDLSDDDDLFDDDDDSDEEKETT